MIFTIICMLAAVFALISILSFVLFIRARVKEDEAKEKLYKQIHYTSLTVFTILLIAALNLYEDPD